MTITMETRTIDVTQDHIDAGIRGQCKHCPIALAINEHVPGNVFTLVGPATIEFHINPHTEHVRRLTTDTPERASLFVVHYDEGGDAAPFAFDLAIPCTEEKHPWLHT